MFVCLRLLVMSWKPCRKMPCLKLRKPQVLTFQIHGLGHSLTGEEIVHFTEKPRRPCAQKDCPYQARRIAAGRALEHSSDSKFKCLFLAPFSSFLHLASTSIYAFLCLCYTAALSMKEGLFSGWLLYTSCPLGAILVTSLRHSRCSPSKSELGALSMRQWALPCVHNVQRAPRPGCALSLWVWSQLYAPSLHLSDQER